MKKMSKYNEDIANNIIAKYIFMKTAGGALDEVDYKHEKTAGWDKVKGFLSAFPHAAGEVIGGTLNTIKALPVYGMGVGAGTGALWWLLNRKNQQEQAIHQMHIKKINKKLQELADEGVDEYAI